MTKHHTTPNHSPSNRPNRRPPLKRIPVPALHERAPLSLAPDHFHALGLLRSCCDQAVRLHFATDNGTRVTLLSPFLLDARTALDSIFLQLKRLPE